MAQRKVNARDIVFQVESSTPDTWLEIAGLTSATLNQGENEEVAETTDFDSNGAYEEDVMQRGASWGLEGQLELDDTTGVQDPGQARVESLAALVGAASHGRVRFRHPAQTTWKVWDATFKLGEQGGGNNDKVSWAATITRSGASTTMAVS